MQVKERKIAERKIADSLHFFAVKLRDYREDQGLSRRSLAEQVGVNQLTIRHIESGRCRPTFETVLRLSVALGLNLEQVRRMAS